MLSMLLHASPAEPGLRPARPNGAGLTSSAVPRSSAQQEHTELNNGRGLEELGSPSGSSETPKCSRCGRDGPRDYNCCHPGGAWAGVCGDEGMVARGAANFTYVQGFVVCQERLKRAANGQHKRKETPRPSVARTRPINEGHGLLAIYVRLPGSPDLAQHLCSEAAASQLRCRTVAEDGIAAELERPRGKHGNLLLTMLTAPATMPTGAFYFVSLTNPLEVLSALPRSSTRNALRRNPQCAALLPPGETASLAACTRLWQELSKRCNWVGDLRDARAHRVLVTALVERGGEAWRHARPPAAAPIELAPFEPEPLRFIATALELEPLRERHAADYALYRLARKEHATCARGGRYVRGEDDTPPYTQIGRYYSTVTRLALGCAQAQLLRLLRRSMAALGGPRGGQLLPRALEQVASL